MELKYLNQQPNSLILCLLVDWLSNMFIYIYYFILFFENRVYFLTCKWNFQENECVFSEIYQCFLTALH